MEKKTVILSAANSLEGYSFWSWLKGNWTTIKEIGKVVAPAILGWVMTHQPILTVAVTLGGKFLLDMLDFYLGKAEIKEK